MTSCQVYIVVYDSLRRFTLFVLVTVFIGTESYGKIHILPLSLEQEASRRVRAYLVFIAICAPSVENSPHFLSRQEVFNQCFQWESSKPSVQLKTTQSRLNPFKNIVQGPP